jgi:hypothetical protein
MQQELIVMTLLFALVGTVSFFSGKIFERNKDKPEVPVLTEKELSQYDDLPAGIAIAESWTGPKQKEVRSQMPILGRALDRLVENDSSKGVK